MPVGRTPQLVRSATVVAAGIVVTLISAGRGHSAQAPGPFFPASLGCAMVHCDPRMSDIARMPAPAGTASVRAHDTIPTGSGNPTLPPGAQNHGNGCAANGRVAVCSYNNAFGDNVVAYAADGTRVWTSGGLLNSTSFASVPMVDRQGHVIAADNQSLIRFDATGRVVWHVATPGGTPISPVVTQSGAVVLATKGGPISAFDGAAGELIGSIVIRDSPEDEDFFDTANTPCVLGNRIYVSMARRNDAANAARLVAIDVDVENPDEPLRVAWHYPFGGPSGASPLCAGSTVYFDGARLNPGDPDEPQIFAVRDDGAVGTLVWARRAPNRAPSSFAQDPRGGFWAIFLNYSRLERRSMQTGSVLDTIDIPAVVGGTNPQFPHSVMTVAGSVTNPVLILGTVDASLASSYVAAVDLVAHTALWTININPAFGTDNITGQFPIVVDSRRRPVVVFSGRASGAYFVTEP